MPFAAHFKNHGFRLLIGVTFALGLAWVTLPWWGTTAELRLFLVGGSLVVMGGLIRWEQMTHSDAERTAKRFLDHLCRLDPHDLGNPQVIETLPSLADENPWNPAITRIRDRLIDWGRRADEAEHARASCGVHARRLENDLAQVREILDRVTDPIVGINHYDEVTFANEAARRVLGLAKGSKSFPNADAGPGAKALIELLIEARRRKSGSIRTGELELMNPAGQLQAFRFVTRTLAETEGDSGPGRGALCVLTDISHQKGIQKRHAEFVASASHEMKTPLSSIRAYVELLQDGEAEDDATKEEFLQVIETQAERLQRLIENLLNLARIEAGVVKVDKQPISLNEVLEQAYNVVAPAAQQKPIELVRDLSPMFLGVLADRDMILQAAINLLSNAVKYTPANGKVTLRSRMDDNAATFEVEDTGVGLSPDDCQKVFEKFYRVKKDQQMAPGTGLGLPLAKHIIEDVHGGAIAVSSQLNVGSVFRATLPVVSRSKS